MKKNCTPILLLMVLLTGCSSTELDSSLLGTWILTHENVELTITPNTVIINERSTPDTLPYDIVSPHEIKLPEAQILLLRDGKLLIAEITKGATPFDIEKYLLYKKGYEFENSRLTKKNMSILIGSWALSDTLQESTKPPKYSHFRFFENSTIEMFENSKSTGKQTFHLIDSFITVGLQTMKIDVQNKKTITLRSISNEEVFHLHKTDFTPVNTNASQTHLTMQPIIESSSKTENTQKTENLTPKADSLKDDKKLTPKQKEFLGTWILDPALPQESRSHKSLQFTPEYVIYIRDNNIDTCDYQINDSNLITLSTEVELTFTYTLSPTSLTLVNDLQVLPFVKKGEKHRLSKATKANKKKLTGKWIVTRVKEEKTSFISPLDDGDTVTYLFDSSDTLDYSHNGKSKGRKPYYLRDNYFCFDPMYSQKFEFVNSDSLIIKQLSEDLILFLKKVNQH